MTSQPENEPGNPDTSTPPVITDTSVPEVALGWMNPVGPDPILYPDPPPPPPPPPASGTPDIGSGTPDIGSGTPDVGSGTPDVGSGTADLASGTPTVPKDD